MTEFVIAYVILGIITGLITITLGEMEHVHTGKIIPKPLVFICVSSGWIVFILLLVYAVLFQRGR